MDVFSFIFPYMMGFLTSIVALLVQHRLKLKEISAKNKAEIESKKQYDEHCRIVEVVDQLQSFFTMDKLFITELEVKKYHHPFYHKMLREKIDTWCRELFNFQDSQHNHLDTKLNEEISKLLDHATRLRTEFNNYVNYHSSPPHRTMILEEIEPAIEEHVQALKETIERVKTHSREYVSPSLTILL